MANDYLVHCANCGKQVSLSREVKDPTCIWCSKPALRKVEESPPIVQSKVGRGSDKKPRRGARSHWDQKKDEIIAYYKEHGEKDTRDHFNITQATWLVRRSKGEPSGLSIRWGLVDPSSIGSTIKEYEKHSKRDSTSKCDNCPVKKELSTLRARFDGYQEGVKIIVGAK